MKRFICLFSALLLYTQCAWAGSTFSRVKTWSSGQTLTASDLNAEFDSILNNLTPSGIDDYSATTTAMRSTADPYPGSTESLATSLAGELERIRYQILGIKNAIQTGQTYWYEDLPTAGVFTVAGSSVGVNDTTPDYAFDVAGTAGVSSDLTVGGNLILAGSLSGASGSIELSTITTTADKLRISSHTAIAGNLEVSGTGNITGTLTGAAGDFSGAFDAAGALTENANRVFSGASMFESSTQTIAGDSTLTLAHGLAGIPRLVQVYIKCETGEVGYSAGDEVNVTTQYERVSASSDATNIKVFTDAVPVVTNTGYTQSNVTVAYWKYIVRAWY